MPKQQSSKPMRTRTLNNSNMKQKKMKMKGNKNSKKVHTPQPTKKTGTVPRRRAGDKTEIHDQLVQLRTGISNGKKTIKSKRIDLELGLTVDLDNSKRKMEHYSNDNLVLDLNSKNLLSQRKGVRALALVLNRLEFPPDVSKIIIHHGRNNITLEKNIFKLMPYDIIKAIHYDSVNGLKEEEKDLLMAKYKNTESIYEFLYNVFGFRKTKNLFNRYYNWYNDDDMIFYDTSFSRIGRIRNNNGNIYNIITHIEDFMHMHNL